MGPLQKTLPRNKKVGYRPKVVKIEGRVYEIHPHGTKKLARVYLRKERGNQLVRVKDPMMAQQVINRLLRFQKGHRVTRTNK